MVRIARNLPTAGPVNTVIDNPFMGTGATTAPVMKTAPIVQNTVPASAPPVTSTPPAQSSPPVTTPTPSASDNYVHDLGTATTIANGMLAGNASATISDPHAAENAEYLKMLKARLGGLDSKEMQAAKDEGLLGLDHEVAQNLERYGSIAGANGVQGGARAGLMGKALNEGNLARGQLERQLLMDNIASKDRAYQAYGGALGNATQTGLDIGKYNAGAQDRDTGLKMSLPFDIMSGIGGYQARDDAKSADDKALEVLKGKLSGSGTAAPGATGSGTQAAASTTDTDKRGVFSTPVSANPAADADQITANLNATGAEIGNMIDHEAHKDWGAVQEKATSAAGQIWQRVKLQNPSASDMEIQTEYDKQLQEWLWNAGIIKKRYGDSSLRDAASGAGFSYNDIYSAGPGGGA